MEQKKLNADPELSVDGSASRNTAIGKNEREVSIK